jgi:hypothetical protein
MEGRRVARDTGARAVSAFIDSPGPFSYALHPAATVFLAVLGQRLCAATAISGLREGIQRMFDYDWFRGAAFEQQKHDAKLRCARKHYPDDNPAQPSDAYRHFFDELEARVLIYLRDGFSYEFKELANVSTGNHLTFECEPVDEHYKVGAFVVAVPFEDIVRVEVYAVHPSEKPEDVPLITGFRSGPESPVPREELGEPKHR